jgi:hypothetical protein
MWRTKKYFVGNVVHHVKQGGSVKFVVGEETNMISPRLDVEEIVCRFLKAVAILDTWPTEDEFLKGWNEDVFKGACDAALDRYTYLGWRHDEYVGWRWESDGGELEESRRWAQMNTYWLSQCYDYASVLVEAMTLMDDLIPWTKRALEYSCGLKTFFILHPFDFGFKLQNEF